MHVGTYLNAFLMLNPNMVLKFNKFDIFDNFVTFLNCHLLKPFACKVFTGNSLYFVFPPCGQNMGKSPFLCISFALKDAHQLSQCTARLHTHSTIRTCGPSFFFVSLRTLAINPKLFSTLEKQNGR